jgi:hypothetical protein
MPTINPGLPTASAYVWKADRRRAKAELREKQVRFAAEIEADRARSLARLVKKVQDVIESTGLESWTCGDGRAVLVKDMTDSHLHFAIAKAFRNEYPDSRSRDTGVEALKREALRRLLRSL